jgi:hypothetical protein
MIGREYATHRAASGVPSFRARAVFLRLFEHGAFFSRASEPLAERLCSPGQEQAVFRKDDALHRPKIRRPKDKRANALSADLLLAASGASVRLMMFGEQRGSTGGGHSSALMRLETPSSAQQRKIT